MGHINPWLHYARAIDDHNRAREIWYNVRRTICRLGEQPHFLAAERRTWAALMEAKREQDHAVKQKEAHA